MKADLFQRKRPFQSETGNAIGIPVRPTREELTASSVANFGYLPVIHSLRKGIVTEFQWIGNQMHAVGDTSFNS